MPGAGAPAGAPAPGIPASPAACTLGAVSRTRQIVGRSFLAGYTGVTRVQRKAFSLLASGGFASFGAHSVISPPIRLDRADRIAVGAGVFIARGCWLHAEGDEQTVAIEIGDGTSIGAYSTLSATHSLRLGRNVLTAPGIYISDHSHEFGDPLRAVSAQGLTPAAAVEIGEGTWLGEGVVVCPGVRIGRFAVIGANSVVNTDIPDGGVAVGAPARVVRVRTGAPVA